MGATSAAGGAMGLLLGGVLTEYLSWRWCLLVNVVFAAVALIGGVRLLPRSTDPTRPSINMFSATLVSLALFGIVYGLSRSETDGWGDPLTVGTLAGGTAILVLFVIVQARSAQPPLPLRVVNDRRRAGPLLAIFAAGAGMFGVFLFVTFYLQRVLEFSAVLTGVAFLPMVALLGAAAQIGVRVLARTGPRPLVLVGALSASGAMAWLTRIDATSSYSPDVLLPLMLIGVGCGLIFAAAITNATLGLPAEDAGVGSALVNTAQQIGGAVGIAVLSTQAGTAGKNKALDLVRGAHFSAPTPAILRQANIAAFTTAFWWAAAIFLGAAILCTLVLPAGPASTAVDIAPPTTAA